MNRYRMKCVGVCMLAMLLLAGCGAAKVPEVVDVTTLVVSGDGAVTSYLVDVFDKEYYKLSDLTEMATKEVADFNSEVQTGETVPVMVDKVEALEDGSNKVVVTHKYDSAESYEQFNEGVLFYGTVNEAVEAGYGLDVVLQSVKDDTLYTEAQLLQYPDKYLLITDAKAVIYCPKKVAFVSKNASYNANGSVDASQTEGTVVIFMK